MEKFYDFKDGIDFNDFYYCYSPQAQNQGVFEREDDCIKSRFNEEIGKFEYTTIMLNEKLSVGYTVETECMWEKRGAPLLVIAEDVFEKDGLLTHGEHFEVVVFEEGCNVWHLMPTDDPNVRKHVIPTKIHFEDIPTPNFSRVKLKVTFVDKGVKVVMNGREFSVSLPTMPSVFNFGITGCEGINRFYNLKIYEE